MNSFRCYWTYRNKLGCMDVDDVESAADAIQAVKEYLDVHKLPYETVRRVLALVK